MAAWQNQAPKRRRRKFMLVPLAVAAALIAVGILRAVPSGPSGGDYRDPARLAEAMKQAHHSAAASCAKIAAPKYVCYVAFTDGTGASYTVAVAPDGKSYSAS